MNRLQKIKSLIERTDPTDLQAHQVLISQIYREVCSVAVPRNPVQRYLRSRAVVDDATTNAGFGFDRRYRDDKIDRLTERLLIALDEGRLS